MVTVTAVEKNKTATRQSPMAIISNIGLEVFLALGAADRTTTHALKIKGPREQSVRGLLPKAVLQKQEHRYYRSCIANANQTAK